MAPSRAPRVVGPRVYDGMITTERPNQRWGTDATSTVTVKDGAVTVFIGVDHCTFEGIGIHAARRATRFEALEPIRLRGAPAVRRCLRLWVRTFQTVEELRQALLDWLHLYNEQWLIERHGFRSPIQVRRDLLVTWEAA